MNTRSGIYSITNLANGHSYIGSAVDIIRRWNGHRRHLQVGTHHNAHLQLAWNLYGPDAFQFDIIEECEPDLLIQKEQAWLDTHPEYNILQRARSAIGYRHTEASRQKMVAAWTPERRKSEAIRIAEKMTPEIVAKAATSNRGQRRTAETCAKMSAQRMGKPWTEARWLAQQHVQVRGHPQNRRVLGVGEKRPECSAL